MYFELSPGFLQWWNSEEDAQRRARPLGSVCMLGLQHSDEDRCIRLRTAGSEGDVYAIRTNSAAESVTWLDHLWLHADYCESEFEFFKAVESYKAHIMDRSAASESAATVQAMRNSHLKRPSLAASAVRQRSTL